MSNAVSGKWKWKLLCPCQNNNGYCVGNYSPALHDCINKRNWEKPGVNKGGKLACLQISDNLVWCFSLGNENRTNTVSKSEEISTPLILIYGERLWGEALSRSLWEVLRASPHEVLQPGTDWKCLATLRFSSVLTGMSALPPLLLQGEGEMPMSTEVHPFLFHTKDPYKHIT